MHWQPADRPAIVDDPIPVVLIDRMLAQKELIVGSGLFGGLSVKQDMQSSVLLPSGP